MEIWKDGDYGGCNFVVLIGRNVIVLGLDY